MLKLFARPEQGHQLPIGRSEWRMNESVAASGMALFFCLSGFLITQFLLADQSIGIFLIKRFFRIIPLAWLATIVLIVVQGPSTQTAIANLLFYANLPTPQMLEGGGHFWSLQSRPDSADKPDKKVARHEFVTDLLPPALYRRIAGRLYRIGL